MKVDPPWVVQTGSEARVITGIPGTRGLKRMLLEDLRGSSGMKIKYKTQSNAASHRSKGPPGKVEEVLQGTDDLEW